MELELIRRRTEAARITTLASPATQPSVAPPFKHSEDFRTIMFGGESYNLTSRQAQVVQLLYEEMESGIPEVAQDRILVALDSPASQLRDAFQGANRGLWGMLIVPGKRRETYQFDLKRTHR